MWFFRRKFISLWEAAEIALCRTKDTARAEVAWLNSGYNPEAAKIEYCHLMLMPKGIMDKRSPLSSFPVVTLTGVFDDGVVHARKRVTIDPWEIGAGLVFEINDGSLILKNKYHFSDPYSQRYIDLSVEWRELEAVISHILGENCDHQQTLPIRQRPRNPRSASPWFVRSLWKVCKESPEGCGDRF